MSEQLARIEQKIDILLDHVIGPRPCTPQMSAHLHGTDAASYRMLRADEEPYDTCHVYLNGVTRRIKDL